MMKYILAAGVMALTLACDRASFTSVTPEGPVARGEDAGIQPDQKPTPNAPSPLPAPGGEQVVPSNPDQPGNPIVATNRAPILNCPSQLTLSVGEWVRGQLCRATDPDNDPLSFSFAANSSCRGYRVNSGGAIEGQVMSDSCDLFVTVSDGRLESSARIRIDGTRWNQTIGGDQSETRGFFNESDGALAFFKWQLNQPYSLVSIAFSDDKVELMSWDGRSPQLPRGKVVQNFSHCHPLARSQNSGPLAMLQNGGCGISLAANLSEKIPAARPWEKRFVRFAASNGWNASDTWMSSIRTVANVPDGMTFVDAEEWPLADFPASVKFCTGDATANNRRNCRYDFAIDRFETSAGISSTSPVNPLDYDGIKSPLVREDHQASTGLTDSFETRCPDFPCRVDLSARVDTTRSVGQANGSKVEWVAAKQMCLNRSYDYEFAAWTRLDDLKADDRFTQKTPTPLRKFHLLLDSEFMVASWQTPDTSVICQSEGRHFSGDPLWSNCRSFFGTHDLFGNRNEMTDDMMASETNRVYTRISLYNTQDEITQYVPLIGDGIDSIFFVNSWDFASMLPSQVSATSSAATLGTGDTFIWNTRFPLPYALTRGGGESFFYVGWNQREAIGRYFLEAGLPLHLESRGDGWRGDAGLRCALQPPQKLVSKRQLSFITSSTHTASLGGLSGADAICNSRAREAGYTQAFAALLSDAATDARSRVNIQAPIYSTRGVLIAESAAEFWDGGWKMSPYYDEMGDLVTSVREIWTGSRQRSGTAGWKSDDSGTAASWTSSDPQRYPEVQYGKVFTDADGTRAWLDARRFGEFAGAANSSKRLLCISRETL